jgi:hypothetical protein
MARLGGDLGYAWNDASTFGAVQVTAAEEMTRARDELTGGGPSGYVILRVAEGPGDDNRLPRLRQLIEAEGAISRPPMPGEREALEAGLTALGFR